MSKSKISRAGMTKIYNLMRFFVKLRVSSRANIFALCCAGGRRVALAGILYLEVLMRNLKLNWTCRPYLKKVDAFWYLACPLSVSPTCDLGCKIKQSINAMLRVLIAATSLHYFNR